MKTYAVRFAPEALEQLDNIEQYIAEAASPTVAAHYVDAIVTYCVGLGTFPHRGTRRDDIRLGLRITNYRRQAVIAFDVEASQVSIIGVFYGGQDYETILQTDTIVSK